MSLPGILTGLWNQTKIIPCSLVLIPKLLSDNDRNRDKDETNVVRVIRGDIVEVIGFSKYVFLATKQLLKSYTFPNLRNNIVCKVP